MYQGNWQCSGCGATITELPFEPRSIEGLKCRDCHSKMRAEGVARPQGEKKMYEGEWTCAGCGGVISKLPFEPRNTENLKCIDCFKQNR